MIDENVIGLDWRKMRNNVVTENTILSTDVGAHLKEQHWDSTRDSGYYIYQVSRFPVYVGEYKRESDGSEDLVFRRFDARQDEKGLKFNDLPSEIQVEARKVYRSRREKYGWLKKGYDWL